VPFGPVTATDRRLGGIAVRFGPQSLRRSGQLRTGSDRLGGLAVHIAEIGVDFEVLDPPELVERVKQLAGRFARATG
jgi:hypothetical protein